jgi:hypothetical protein
VTVLSYPARQEEVGRFLRAPLLDSRVSRSEALQTRNSLRSRKKTGRPAPGCPNYFDRQLRVTTDLCIASATLASKPGGLHHLMPPTPLGSASPGLTTLRGSYCANGRSQTKSPADGPVQAEERQAYLIRATRNTTAQHQPQIILKVGSMDVAGPPGVEATVARRSACLVRRPGRVAATFGRPVRLLFTRTNRRPAPTAE